MHAMAGNIRESQEVLSSVHWTLIIKRSKLLMSSYTVSS